MQVDDTLDYFNELQLQHQAVATKTKTLHDACDRLVCFFLLSDLSCDVLLAWTPQYLAYRSPENLKCGFILT